MPDTWMLTAVLCAFLAAPPLYSREEQGMPADETSRGQCDTVQSIPEAGSVFREFTFVPRGRFFAECDPGSTREFCAERKHMTPKQLDLDLKHATRAEALIEYWGGHIGTADQKFSANGNSWIPVPQPANTPTEPQRYYRNVMGTPPVAVPLEHLRDATNEFRFTCGRQIAYSFDWGFYWVYAFTIRVYYDPSLVAHPTGAIVFPASGSTVGDSPVLNVEAQSPNGPIRRADLIAHYEDFDWGGNGWFRDWHYQYQHGSITHHVGSADGPPFEITWDTSWVPDQTAPIKVAARLTDDAGVSTMTDAVEIRLDRPDRSVRMYKPHDVPENFGSRVGRRKSCKIDVPDDLSGATGARLVLSTWSAAHAEEIGLNGTILVPRIGQVHWFSYDAIAVPVQLLRRGENEFHIFSRTEEHAAEVNWPGPVLLVEYPKR